MVASTNPLQTLSSDPPPTPASCNVSSQCSATREVKLALKETAHMQPKDVNGGVLAAVHRGILFSFSLGALLLSRISYCLASKPFSIACHGNRVSWPSFQAIAINCPFFSPRPLPFSPFSPLFSPDHLLLFFSVDSNASYTSDNNQNTSRDPFIFIFIFFIF